MRQPLPILLTIVCASLAASLAGILSGQEGLPTADEISRREMKLEHELGRLRKMEAGMGVNHPQLRITRERISEIQAELVALSRGPGPFAKAMVAERDEVEILLRQMSDTEVRQAVLHLFGRVKDLERRIEQLELVDAQPGRRGR